MSVVKQKQDSVLTNKQLSEKSSYQSEGELTDKQRQGAFEKYQKIEPFLQGHMSLKKLCKKQKISYRTAKRWVYLYKHGGLSGLAVERLLKIPTSAY